jgi:glycosyltransferase involved in cell wall biosynthesis
MFFESGNERELADKVLFLAKNKSYRDEQVGRANVFIKQYNWDVKKNEYLTLVDSLVSGKRGKP